LGVVEAVENLDDPKRGANLTNEEAEDESPPRPSLKKEEEETASRCNIYPTNNKIWLLNQRNRIFHSFMYSLDNMVLMRFGIFVFHSLLISHINRF
jgi:hypothetical protein